MAKFRQRLKEVNAVQWTGTQESFQEIRALCRPIQALSVVDGTLLVLSHPPVGMPPLGDSLAHDRDWIVRTESGDIGAYTDAEFRAGFEPLPEPEMGRLEPNDFEKRLRDAAEL